MTRLRGLANDILTQNATPFLHRYLYTDYTPSCILKCFAANVLYVNRTLANAPMVMQVIESSVKELLIAEAARNEATGTHIDRLARTQALFLYQVLRLLDGELILRSRGERDIPLLETWLRDLEKVRDDLGDTTLLGNSDSVARKQSHPEWRVSPQVCRTVESLPNPFFSQTWIFAESVRRTILIGYAFLSFYQMMKDPKQTGQFNLCSAVHRWTLSRHLWEADSEFEFARRWRDKPHFVIKNFQFQEFLKCGRADDVDSFATLFLGV